VNGLEDRGSIVCHVDDMSVSFVQRLENLVHSFGTERRFDEIGDRNGSNEGLLAIRGCLQFWRTLLCLLLLGH
jgi:hypothetical protein